MKLKLELVNSFFQRHPSPERNASSMGKDGMEARDVETASETCAEDVCSESINSSVLGVQVLAGSHDRQNSNLCKTHSDYLKNAHNDVIQQNCIEEVKCVEKGGSDGEQKIREAPLGLRRDGRSVDADSGLSSLNHPPASDVTTQNAAETKGEIPVPPQICNSIKRNLRNLENMDATPEGGVPTIVVTGEISPPFPYSSKELKSVLKKERGSSKRGRVTFDEAVTLYSDDNPEVQVLALRTADISYADVFYMFEPPLEYQDLLPFEPPAEYRDPDTTEVNEVAPLVISEIPAEEPPSVDDSVRRCNEGSSLPTDTGEKVAMVTTGDYAESQCSEQMQERTIHGRNPTSKRLQDESEDEELNSLFQAFDEELGGEGKNGEFDDMFFKKLLQLLSSLEGEGPFQFRESDLFSSTDFCQESNEEDPEKDSKSFHEGDSDCSASSQDTIVVKASDDSDRNESECLELPESIQGSQESIPREEMAPDILKETMDADSKIVQDSSEVLSRQSSDDRESISGPFRKQNSKEGSDGIHETDDSTSSDSRSGEVEEDCRQDDIGYDEEDAEDYEDESLKGMIHSNSKIRRIIKKNAIQCTLLRGIEARRRQTGKYNRPKSPLPSKDSLVEQLRWLTTVDENKEHNAIRDPIPMSAIPLFSKNKLNGIQSTSSEEESTLVDRPSLIRTRDSYALRPPLQHSAPQQMAPVNSNYMPVVPNIRNPPMIRRWITPDLLKQQHQRVVARVTVPGDFRDWRVIQRVVVNRQGLEEQVIKGAFRSSYPPQTASIPQHPETQQAMANRMEREMDLLRRHSQMGHCQQEFDQFANRDIDRMERIKQRYSLAEDDDDPTFGFAQRPAVRGIRNRIKNSTEILEQLHTSVSSTNIPNPRVGPPPDVVYAKPPIQQQPPPLRNAPQSGVMLPNQWTPNRSVIYRTPFNIQAPHSTYDVHRASVAVAELPNNNSLVDGHYFPPGGGDPRYHSFVENPSCNSFGQDAWVSPPRRSSLVQISLTPNMPPKVTVPVLPSSALPPPPNIPLPCPPMPSMSHQAPSTQMSQNLIYSVITKDERGTPEGASSSPKVSQDSLYHGPGHEKSQSTDPPTKDGVIYYSLNV